MIKALFILIAGGLLCGCASVAPVATSMAGPLGQQPVQANTHTSVNLSEGNFVVVKTNVMGRSKGFSLLGLITVYPATTTKAMSRLYAEAGMQEGKPKTMAHLMIEHSSMYFILFSIPEITARADIVQFNSQTIPDSGGKKDPGGPP
ncbi:MAG: DUF6567 family protein [Verrucomicrobiota bacterium]|jgi:hypothetical protein